MSVSVTRLANTLWYGLCLPESRAFERAMQDVAGTQARLLLGLLRRNADTVWGRRYGLSAIRSVVDYQARVPLTTYDDYRPLIERIAAGERGVLTHEPVRLLEPTSGSTAATKYVLYTATLQAEFQRGIAPWIVSLYRHDPQLLRGQSYWSVSPVLRRDARAAGGIPIGFEEDSAYFGLLQGQLIRAGLAVPGLVKLIEEIDAFRYVTLLFLLRSPALTLISVWKPTFLTLLLQRLPGWWLQLADDIASGTLRSPAPLPADLARRLARLNPRDPQRASAIRRAGRAASLGELTVRLWPQPRLISCWTEAGAARHAAELMTLLPGVPLQGKGLLATEGLVSLPLVGVDGAALAVRSHFFEFLPMDQAQATPLLAHQLARGGVYALVLTTGGGFYHYQLEDLVEVLGYRGTCPLLRCVGKAAHIADHFGEKLNERHVRSALDRLLRRDDLQPGFAMVACEVASPSPAYTLFIQAERADDARLIALGAELEQALQENYHYRYCRALGQLAPLRVFRVTGQALETYVAVCQAHGQRLGDIKPVALHRVSGWADAFAGQMIEG